MDTAIFPPLFLFIVLQKVSLEGLKKRFLGKTVEPF